MHKQIDFTVRGIAPLMMHNGQLADPLNPYAKRLKEVSSKRAKTDDDHQQMSDIEWEGGLYFDESMKVCVPGEVIEGTFANAASKVRLKKQCRAGIISDGNWPLIYDGPKNLDKLRSDPRFRDRRRVVIQTSSVMRTRPIFVDWALKFSIHYLPDTLNPKQVKDIAEIAGRSIGFCDYIPKYGRFMVEKAVEL